MTEETKQAEEEKRMKDELRELEKEREIIQNKINSEEINIKNKPKGANKREIFLIRFLNLFSTKFFELTVFLSEPDKTPSDRLLCLFKKHGLTSLDMDFVQNNTIQDEETGKKIIKLLEEAKNNVFSQSLKEKISKKLKEAKILLMNWQIDELNYKLGIKKFDKGKWQEAIDLLKKVSSHYSGPYYLVGEPAFKGIYFREYEDAQEEIKKVFKEVKRIKEKEETMLKSIETLKNHIRKAEGKANKEAQRMKDELGKILDKIKQAELKAKLKGKKSKRRKILFDESLMEKLEKSQYYRLIKIAYMYLVLEQDLVWLEVKAAELFDIEKFHEDEGQDFPFQPYFEVTSFAYEQELERIEEKLNGKKGPVRFTTIDQVGFLQFKLPKTWEGTVKESRELIKVFQFSVDILTNGKSDLEKRLQDLKQKIKNIKIEA